MDCDFSAPLVPKMSAKRDAYGNSVVGADGKPVYEPVFVSLREDVEEDGTTLVLIQNDTPHGNGVYHAKLSCTDGPRPIEIPI